jgi:hypothetical protein
MPWLVLLLLSLLFVPSATAQTWATLHWDPPVSFPSLGPTERVVYTLWRRGANESTYRRVRNPPVLPSTASTFRVTLPQGSGYICYRVSVLRVPIGGIAVTDSSTFAEVQGFPGCLALCLTGTAPLRSLDAEECAPSY